MRHVVNILMIVVVVILIYAFMDAVLVSKVGATPSYRVETPLKTVVVRDTIVNKEIQFYESQD